MGRLKIILPDSACLGIFKIPVRITDINYGNHVGNNAIVEMVHEARIQFLASHGYSELDIHGVSLIMNELQVVYKNESFYGDILEIRLFIGDITKVSFELYYLIITQRNGKQTEISRAKTGMVGYDYEKKSVSPLPQPFKNILLPS